MTYDELLDLIQDTLQRGDVALAVPTWVRLAEARFNREIRSRKQITRAYSVLQESFIELPDDWLEAANIELRTSPPRPLEIISKFESDRVRQRQESVARFAVIHGPELEVVPAVSEPVEIEMTYYARIPSLSPDRQNNWLLDAWPDLYLYGSLVHSAPYLDQDPRLPQWETMTAGLIESVRQSDARVLFAGSPLRARARTIG